MIAVASNQSQISQGTWSACYIWYSIVDLFRIWWSRAVIWQGGAFFTATQGTAQATATNTTANYWYFYCNNNVMY